MDQLFLDWMVYLCYDYTRDERFLKHRDGYVMILKNGWKLDIQTHTTWGSFLHCPR